MHRLHLSGLSPISINMVPEFEKPRVTEVQVRMDCNGCMQKIKKAVGGVHGICDLYFDFPQQKITIVGWAEPEDIVRAIRKTRKSVTICSHREKAQQPPPDQPAEEQAPPPENQESAAPEASEPPQPPDETATVLPIDQPPHDQPPPEKPPEEEEEEEEAAPPQQAAAALQPEAPTETAQLQPQSGTASREQVHDDYGHGYHVHRSKHHNNQPFPLPADEPLPCSYHPPRLGHRHGGDCSHGYHGRWSNYHSQPFLLPYEPPSSACVRHSYNSYRPSACVTEYEYVRSTPTYTYYGRQEHYSEDYRNGNCNNGSITSMFSDENPNACNIV